MSLTIEQQSLAVLTYTKTQLCLHRGLVQDPFFLANLDHHFATLYKSYSELYGSRADCLESLVSLVGTAAKSWNARPEELKTVDRHRLMKSDGPKTNKQLGGLYSLDTDSDGLEGLTSRIPYFRDLGITYLHIVKDWALASKAGPSTYDEEDDAAGLGSSHALQQVARELHGAGIRLAVDFDLIHTPLSQDWERLTDKGDLEASAFFWVFQDYNVASRFAGSETSLRSLSHGRWVVCSSKRNYDLNYSNPSVLLAMSGELLTLANLGVDIFNLRKVAAIWKQMGQPSTDLPECAQVLHILNTICKIAAPSILLQTDASRTEYANSDKCHLIANRTQMSLSWEALATRNVQLLQLSLEKEQTLAGGHFVNYVRSNENLSFDFPDTLASSCSINPHDHRDFLRRFYTRQFAGAFARGLPSKDGSISGTTASLVGLESGEDLAIERLLLMYSIAFSTGGIAVVNLGDEVGMLNDYRGTVKDADKDLAGVRVHRAQYSERLDKERRDPTTTASHIYDGIRQMISLRRNADEFSGKKLVGFHTHNNHVLGYQRFGDSSRLLCLANFSETVQQLDRARFTMSGAVDLISRKHINLTEGVELDAYQVMWLRIGYGGDAVRPTGTKRYSFRNSPLPSPTAMPCDIDTTLHE